MSAGAQEINKSQRADESRTAARNGCRLGASGGDEEFFHVSCTAVSEEERHVHIKASQLLAAGSLGLEPAVPAKLSNDDDPAGFGSRLGARAECGKRKRASGQLTIIVRGVARGSPFLHPVRIITTKAALGCFSNAIRSQ